MDTDELDFEDSMRGGIECLIPPSNAFDRAGDALMNWLTPGRQAVAAVLIVAATCALSALLPSLPR